MALFVNRIMLYAHVLGAAGLLACLVLLIAAHESEREERAAAWAARLRRPVNAALVVLFLSGGHLSFATGLLQGDSAPLLAVKIGLGLAGMALSLALFRPRAAAAERAPALLRLGLLLALAAAFLGTWIAAAALPPHRR